MSKTLDEIIKKFEWCNNPESDCEYCQYIAERCACDKDALLYLKKYRELLQEIQKLEQPLSWDDLKQMKWKPVFCYTYNGKGVWYVIADIDDKRVKLDDDIYFFRENYMKRWVAYRKEPNEIIG